MVKIKKKPILSSSKIFGVEPTTDYTNFMELVDNTLDPIIDGITSSKHKEYFIDEFFIKTVKLIEITSRGKILSLIDKHALEITDLFHKDQIQISIKNIDEIKKDDFTKGRFIVSNFNFQNIDEIEHVFSTLLGMNVFQSIKEFVKIENIASHTIQKELNDFAENFDKFKDFFDTRHKIIHSSKSINYKQYDVDFFEIWKIRCLYFIFFLSLCVAWYLEIKKGNKIKKDQLKIFLFFKNQMKEYKKRN